MAWETNDKWEKRWRQRESDRHEARRREEEAVKAPPSPKDDSRTEPKDKGRRRPT